MGKRSTTEGKDQMHALQFSTQRVSIHKTSALQTYFFNYKFLQEITITASTPLQKEALIPVLIFISVLTGLMATWYTNGVIWNEGTLVEKMPP